MSENRQKEGREKTNQMTELTGDTLILWVSSSFPIFFYHYLFFSVAGSHSHGLLALLRGLFQKKH